MEEEEASKVLMKTISNDPFPPPLSSMTSIRTPSTYQSAIPIPNYRRQLFFPARLLRRLGDIPHSNAARVGGKNLTDGIITYSPVFIFVQERINPPAHQKSLLKAKLYDSFGTQKRVPLFSEWVCATDWLLIKSFSRRLGLFFTPANEKKEKNEKNSSQL